MGTPSWQSWRSATAAALYGSDGFYRTELPAAHFRTSVHVSPVFASALLTLARLAGLSTVVDVGAGRGELATVLHRLAPDLTLVAVELAARPDELPAGVAWTNSVPPASDALVVANEWLDDIPLDVAEVDDSGVVRLVEVDPATGSERLGSPVDTTDATWLERWWPLRDAPPGTRAEVGRPRDDAWATVVRTLRRGIALAVDYGHVRAQRPVAGTLAGYRAGRVVPPVPDGRCNVTAHVAVDALAAAGKAAGADAGVLTEQRTALMSLGVSTKLPAASMAHADPAGYLELLSRVSEASELVAPDGLGGFWWLLQAKGVELPACPRIVLAGAGSEPAWLIGAARAGLVRRRLA